MAGASVAFGWNPSSETRGRHGAMKTFSIRGMAFLIGSRVEDIPYPWLGRHNLSFLTGERHF